jgi:hypothetical protein
MWPWGFLDSSTEFKAQLNWLTVPEVNSESQDEKTRSGRSSSGGMPSGFVTIARPTNKLGRAMA